MAVTLAEATSPGRHLYYGRQPRGGDETTSNRDKVRFAVVDVTVGVYATGGVAITASALRFVKIKRIVPSGAGGYVFSVDYTDETAPKLLLWQSSAGAGAHTQVADTTDLSAITVRCLVYGTPT